MFTEYVEQPSIFDDYCSTLDVHDLTLDIRNSLLEVRVNQIPFDEMFLVDIDKE